MSAGRPRGRKGRDAGLHEGRSVDAETQAILGAAILGIGGDEAIHGIIDMMSVGATATQLRHTVPIHPTVSELIPTLLADARATDSGPTRSTVV